MDKVSAIIAIHNGIDYTLKFLESLKKTDWKNLEIIIIDDGSTDNSAAVVSKLYPEIKIISGDGNLWWTKSMNLGFKYAIENKADYILILNNDIEVDKNLIKELVKCTSEKPNTVVASKA